MGLRWEMSCRSRLFVTNTGASTHITFDFGKVYNQPFEGKRYHALVVNYAREPEHLATYSETDRDRIMGVIQRAAALGG